MAAVLMLAALAAFYWWSPRQADVEVGSGVLIVSTLNSVELKSQKVSQVQELTTQTPLVTGPDSEAVLLAGGPGNEITLGPESSLSLARSQGNRNQLDLEQGSVFITETRAKISVRTAHLMVEPIGTEYEVRRHGDETTVSVLEGRVAVRAPDRRRMLTLAAGESLTVGRDARWEELRPRRLNQTELKPMRRYRALPRLKFQPLLGSALIPRSQPQTQATPAYPKAKPQPRQIPPRTRPDRLEPATVRARGQVRTQTRRPVVQPRSVRRSDTRGTQAPRARRTDIINPPDINARRQSRVQRRAESKPSVMRELPAYRPTRARTQARTPNRVERRQPGSPGWARPGNPASPRDPNSRLTKRRARDQEDPTRARRGPGRLDLTRTKDWVTRQDRPKPPGGRTGNRPYERRHRF